jgi:hypothetical protein
MPTLPYVYSMQLRFVLWNIWCERGEMRGRAASTSEFMLFATKSALGKAQVGCYGARDQNVVDWFHRKVRCGSRRKRAPLQMEFGFL